MKFWEIFLFILSVLLVDALLSHKKIRNLEVALEGQDDDIMMVVLMLMVVVFLYM